MTHRTSRSGGGLRSLVVGAGIAGLGAARALRQRGFVAEVIERESAWTHAGAGIYLPGNAARLRALGLQSAVVERGSLITRQRLCDHHGRVLADIDVSAQWGEVGPCVALHRADLHEVLVSHGDPVLVRMGQPMRQLSQRDNTVTVGFGDATADCYDLVIGADGTHSMVRHLAVGVCKVQPVGQLAWRFVTECPPDVTTWTVLLGRNVAFLAVPIGRGQVYCYCDAPERTPRSHGDDVKGTLVELLTGFAEPVPAILDTLGPDQARCADRRGDARRVVRGTGATGRRRRARNLTQHGRRRRNGPRRWLGTRRVPRLPGRCRAGSGEVPGATPPTHAMGPRPDTPP